MTENIAKTLAEVAARNPDRKGLIEARTGACLTFSELLAYSQSLAFHFTENGVRAGDRVMLMVPPSADFICLTFALFSIGAPVILIDPGMGYKNLLRCIAGVRPEVFIGIPKAHLFRKFFPKPFVTVKKQFCCGFSFGLFGSNITEMARRHKQIRPIEQPGPDDLAAIIFTTGSTGPPKGVRYEHSIFAAQLELIRTYWGITPEDVDQPAFPLFALFSAALGACSVIPDMDPSRPATVDPEKFLDSIERYKVTYSFGSPAIWNVVSSYCIEEKKTIPGLKQVLMAGAPVPGRLIETLSSILPKDARIHTPYGATESLPIVSIEGREIIDKTWPLTRIGKGTCVGRPLPGIEIKIISISDDIIESLSENMELATGEIGEIIVRGDVVTRAYENNAKETNLAKIQDGNTFWHRLGDTGYLDNQRRLWFCGRRAHRVVTEQGVLFTIPCEAIVNEHPEVFRSALVGITNQEKPQFKKPVLIIEKEKKSKRKDEEIRSEIKDLTTASALTKDITNILFNHDFPVDIRHNAKIFREKLADWAEVELTKR